MEVLFGLGSARLTKMVEAYLGPENLLLFAHKIIQISKDETI